MIRWPHLPKHPFVRLVVVAIAAGFIPLWLSLLKWIPIPEVEFGISISIIIAHVGVAAWIIGLWIEADTPPSNVRELVRNLYELIPYRDRNVHGMIYYPHEFEEVKNHLTKLIKKGLRHDS